MPDEQSILDQAHAAFPNLSVELEDDRLGRAIQSRRLGRYSLTLLRVPATSVEAIGRRSLSAGLGNHLKLIWQLGGTMGYEDADHTYELTPGDLIITSMASDYRLDMREGHEALVLAFDPADESRWAGIARDTLAQPLGPAAGITVASTGLRLLLGCPSLDATGELTARTMVDLALSSAREVLVGSPVPEPPIVSRAGLQIVRNISDTGYKPSDLARDLGMSRRSLYSRLSPHGLTPAALIRQVRLERARQDVLRDRGRSLVDIAIANGFPDGASLSRAFRAAFGVPPSNLRKPG